MPPVEGGFPDQGEEKDVVTIQCACTNDVAHVLNTVVEWAVPDPTGETYRLVGYRIDGNPPTCRVELFFALSESEA